LFLEIKEYHVFDIKGAKWILDLAFMVDITEHPNELSVYLQGKNKHKTSIYENVKAFQTKTSAVEVST
jgi:hypothetical protein